MTRQDTKYQGEKERMKRIQNLEDLEIETKKEILDAALGRESSSSCL